MAVNSVIIFPTVKAVIHCRKFGAFLLRVTLVRVNSDRTFQQWISCCDSLGQCPREGRATCNYIRRNLKVLIFASVLASLYRMTTCAAKSWQ